MNVYILEFWHDCCEGEYGIYGIYADIETAKKTADKIAKKEGYIEEFKEGKWEKKKSTIRGAKSIVKEWVLGDEEEFREYTITECKLK